MKKNTKKAASEASWVLLLMLGGVLAGLAFIALIIGIGYAVYNVLGETALAVYVGFTVVGLLWLLAFGLLQDNSGL